MITNTITQKIGEALKAHDEVRLSTLRMLSSALNYERIAKQHDLSEEEEINVVRHEVKKRKDAIEMYGKAGVQDREKANEKIKKEVEEMKILQEYLPAEMDDKDIADLVDFALKETGVTELREMGKVIALVKLKSEGRADGSKIASLVKSKLSG